MRTKDVKKLRVGDYVTIRNHAGVWCVTTVLTDGVVQLATKCSKLTCAPKYIDRVVSCTQSVEMYNRI